MRFASLPALLAGALFLSLAPSTNADEVVPQQAAPPGKPWEAAWGFWPKSPDTWGPTHWTLVKRAQSTPVKILFLGDSITKGWAGAGKDIWASNYAPLEAVNVGMGGDTTRQTLWRLDHQAMEGLQPRLVVLMIGVNNIFTRTGTDEEIAEGISVTLKKIQSLSPTSKILLLGVLPVGNEEQAARIRNINLLIAKLAGPSVTFLDMSPKFVNADGKADPTLYTPDLVHLATPGYARWDETMRPVLEGLLK